MREVARRLIEEEQERAGRVFPWTDLPSFVERLWPAQELQLHASAQLPGPVFFDRGIPDALAFLGRCGIPATDPYLEACRRCRYDLVFDLEPLPVYTRDPQRPYDETEALVLRRLNREAYRALGYSLVPIPVMPAGARVDFMLAKTLQWEGRR